MKGVLSGLVVEAVPEEERHFDKAEGCDDSEQIPTDDVADKDTVFKESAGDEQVQSPRCWRSGGGVRENARSRERSEWICG